MILIPAVDIKGGNCVRLSQGIAENETIYSSSPLEIAKRWETEGAERVHLVDLDGAFEGRPVNGKIIAQIAEELKVPVQAGGGIRDMDTASFLIGRGVSKIIIGTSALEDLDFLRMLLKRYPGKIIAGVDSRDGKLAVSGWKELTEISALDFAEKMEAEGVSEIIITDITEDGMMRGPNLKWIKEITGRVSINVIAAGGVSSPEDIKKLKDLNIPNLKGAVVGKALFSRPDFIKEAIKITKGVG